MSLVKLGRDTFAQTYHDHFEKDFSLKSLESYLKLTFNPSSQSAELNDPSSAFLVIEDAKSKDLVAYAKISKTTHEFGLSLGEGLCIERIYVI